MQSLTFNVHKSQHNQRLDLFLVVKCKDLSRRKIRTIIDQGGAFLNGKRVRIASKPVQTNDKVLINYSEENLKKKRDLVVLLPKKAVLFTSPEIVVINKPSGMPSQPTRTQSVFHAISSLRELFPDWSSFSLTHRLDQDTSGVLVIARNINSMNSWTEKFKERSLEKTYLALTRGKPAQKEFIVENHLSLIDPKTTRVHQVRSGGRRAKTSFTLLHYCAEHDLSLISCKPETGRSHQIRVHLADLGLPILGDKKYGDFQSAKNLAPEIQKHALAHHMLHAWQLSDLKNPEFRFIAPAPETFLSICLQIGVHLDSTPPKGC